MKPILYLHVGVHKTGTTAIQKFLFDNADRLNEAGIFRPVTGALDNAVSWGHHELAWTLRDGDKSGLWRKARLEIAGKKAVVSSEEFCLIRGAHSYAPVRDAFDGWSIRPICYVRRQDQLLESIYNHHVKSLGETEDIQSFAKRLGRRLDYKQFIDTLEGVFGQGSVTVRVYDKREFDDLFDDFLLQLGVNGAGWNRPATAVNPGLSSDGVRLMLKANRALKDAPDALKRSRAQIMREQSSPAFAAYDILSADEREQLMKRFQADNDEIAFRFLGRSRLFD